MNVKKIKLNINAIEVIFYINIKIFIFLINIIILLLNIILLLKGNKKYTFGHFFFKNADLFHINLSLKSFTDISNFLNNKFISIKNKNYVIKKSLKEKKKNSFTFRVDFNSFNYRLD